MDPDKTVGLDLTFHVWFLGQFMAHLLILVRLPGSPSGGRNGVVSRGGRGGGGVSRPWRRRRLQHRRNFGNFQHRMHGAVERSCFLTGGSDKEGGLQDAVVVVAVGVVEVGLVEATFDGVPLPEGLVEAGRYGSLPSTLLGQQHVVTEGVRKTLI